jgi:hypothetical protein
VTDPGDRDVPVKAKAVLIDPRTMTVVWANEAASEDVLGEAGGALSGTSIGRLVPMAEALGVPEALRSVADTGIARHLHADLVSMARGSVAMVVSVYRLPDGMLLVIIENAWQMAERKAHPRHGSRQ